MTSSLISVTVEESHQPRIRKYHQNNDLFTSKNENPTARSGQLDTKEILPSEDECEECEKNYLVLDIFSDGLSDIEAFNHHLSSDTDFNDRSDGGTMPHLFRTMANTSTCESAQISTMIHVTSRTACKPINQLFSDSELSESQVSDHSVISSSSTTSEHGMSQDYTLSFEAKNPILIGSECSSFRTSQAAFMAKRARIKRRQTIVKPKLQFKLCNAIAHKIQVPYYVKELTNNSFLKEQHTEFSNNENKDLKNDGVSYGLTNNTMGHTTGNSLKRVSHDTQAFVKKWLDRKDEIITDCEPPKRLADGRILSLERERLDSVSKQITKYSRVQEEKLPVSDSIVLLSNYSCEYDRAWLFERS